MKRRFVVMALSPRGRLVYLRTFVNPATAHEVYAYVRRQAELKGWEPSFKIV